jgi:transposase
MGDRKRRFWSDEEKRSICLQTSAPGVSVAQVARRYSMNANLIFTWLRDDRFTPDFTGEPGSAFLPVEICRDIPVDLPVVSTGCLRIELAGGHRIVAEGGFDADALGQLLKGWLS